MVISMSTIDTCKRVINSYKLARKLGAEFTRKEFDAATCDKWGRHKGTATLTLMQDERLVKVVRKEECGTKEIEVPAWQARYVMIDRNGNEFMEEKMFLNLPAEARNAMLALNGEDFKVERKDTKTIQLTRNIYAVDENGWATYVGKANQWVKKFIDKCINEKNEADYRVSEAMSVLDLV